MARARDKATDEISKKAGVGKRQAWRIRKKLFSGLGELTEEDLALIAQFEPKDKAKILKLITECEYKQEQLAILKRQHVAHSEMMTVGIKLGSMLSEFAGSCIGNWPSDFAGCTEIQIREKATKYWDSFLSEFRAAVKRI